MSNNNEEKELEAEELETAPEAETPEQQEEPEVVLTPLEAAQKEAAENLAGWQRCMADYKNLVADADRRVGDARKYGSTSLLMELLPMVDHFNYALKGMPADMADSPFLKGVEYIQQNFMKVLEENGVKVIPTVGEVFDTAVHESVEEVEQNAAGETGKSGTVAEEMATGFTLNEKVIQVAKVKVYK